MAINDLLQNLIWAEVSGPAPFTGTVTVGPFPASHVKAKTCLEMHSQVNPGDASDVATYIFNFVQNGGVVGKGKKLGLATLDASNVTEVTFGIEAFQVNARGAWEIFFM